MKKLMIAALGLLTLASCSDDDNDNAPTPATQEEMEEISGHWYAELPISGETENWRTEEEGDSTSYNMIGALIYLNGHYTDACYWGYLYLQDGDMVNFDGLHRRDEEANFTMTLDSNGNVTASSLLPAAPQVSNMHYDGNVITADVTFNGRSLTTTFKHTELLEEATLREFYSILAEEGIVGGLVGFSDNGNGVNTDVKEDPANQPSRSRQLNN